MSKQTHPPPLALTYDSFKRKLKRHDSVVVFMTAHWCNPCKTMYDFWAETKDNHPEISFYKIDVDESQEVSDSLNVESMPTFVFFYKNREVKRFTGASKTKLTDSISYINSLRSIESR